MRLNVTYTKSWQGMLIISSTHEIPSDLRTEIVALLESIAGVTEVTAHQDRRAILCHFENVGPVMFELGKLTGAHDLDMHVIG